MDEEMDLPENIKILFAQGDKTFNIYEITEVQHINGWIKIVNKHGSEFIINMVNVNAILKL